MSEVATTKPRAKTKAGTARPIARALPEATDSYEADFLRGRDLAVAMLAEADEIQHVGQERTYHRRAYRDGHAQNRFTEKYIEQLIEYPTMRDGFNAVLSAKLGDQCVSKASHYAVPMAEYQAGAVGADGTALCDDDVSEEKAAPQAEPQAPVQTTASVHDLPAVLTLQQVDQWTEHFSGAEAVLTMLAMLYSGECVDDAREVAASEDIMGILQHADHLLRQINKQIIEVNGVLPDDLRWRTYEACAIVSLLESIGFHQGFSLDKFGDEFLVDYLNAALVATARAHAALKEHWEAQHA